ncbi:MAG: hypothetical protein AVDCRST_MAG32-1091 [uncultured Nocardioides sp.]|uniref:Uncharacterized protein n=1 Tax=uncultured Nocardioides sp. TaxID=198441 RepID=A0A6J4N743_9ACTN|nr:MAG: hypothetical protein AVDCRST_MAG32-1091 [uncultured Nocardioides sp.]
MDAQLPGMRNESRRLHDRPLTDPSPEVMTICPGSATVWHRAPWTGTGTLNRD